MANIAIKAPFISKRARIKKPLMSNVFFGFVKMNCPPTSVSYHEGKQATSFNSLFPFHIPPCLLFCEKDAQFKVFCWPVKIADKLWEKAPIVHLKNIPSIWPKKYRRRCHSGITYMCLWVTHTQQKMHKGGMYLVVSVLCGGGLR